MSNILIFSHVIYLELYIMSDVDVMMILMVLLLILVLMITMIVVMKAAEIKNNL